MMISGGRRGVGEVSPWSWERWEEWLDEDGGKKRERGQEVFQQSIKMLTKC